MDILNSLLAKYQDDPYMLSKLNAYMTNLPAVLENIHSSRIRKQALASTIDELVAQLSQGFYYLAGRFVVFNETYSFITKDDVLHELYRRMTGLSLPCSKHHLCQHIMARIRRTPFYEACEPTRALQRAVVRTLCTLFASKALAKYFSVILGDILLNKKGLIYFISSSFKPFLADLEPKLPGTCRLDCFKHKYHEHTYVKSRVIPEGCKGGLYTGSILDLVSVAVWYSRKYGTADKYADKMVHAPMVFTLRDNTPLTLVHVFLGKYTSPALGKTVPFKNVYYMWRHFLRSMSLPCVIAKHNLKHIMKEEGIIEDDICINIDIVGRANIFNFEQFWDQCIQPCPTNEFTLSELVAVYNNWCDTRSLYISEEECLAWGRKTHSWDTEVIPIRCSLWDKASDIENALEVFKYDPSHCEDLGAKYAFYRAYTGRISKFIVTFEYFKKYVTIFSSH